MKFYLLVFLLFPLISFSQIQIGEDIDGEAVGDGSGQSVSLSADGSIVAIGARGNDANGEDSGHVRIYENISGTWTQIGQDIDGEAAGDWSGGSVSLSADGSVVAIGAVGNGGLSGHVRVFENLSGIWTQIGQDIDGEAEGDNFGRSVSLSADGSVVAIGGPGNESNGEWSGRVRIYENISGIWTQIGQAIDGEAAEDYSGRSVSLSGDGNIVAIGARGNDVNGEDSGYVRIYENISGLWVQIGPDINGEDSGDWFGFSVSLSNDGAIIAIGALGNAGHVRIYENQSGSWIQIGQDINGEDTGDWFGYSVRLSNDGAMVAIGSPLNGGGISNKKGQVGIYKNESETWYKIDTDIMGEAIGDNSGWAVSLSDDGLIVAIGAIGNDDNGQSSGNVRVYQLTGNDLSVLENELNSFIISPNPTKNQFTIQLRDAQELEQVNIYNNLGQLVKTADTKIIKTTNLATGLYYVEVITNQGKATKKLVIE